MVVDGCVTGADDAGSKVVEAGRADVDVDPGTVVAAVVLAAVVVVVDEQAANTAINPTPIARRDRVLIGDAEDDASFAVEKPHGGFLCVCEIRW